MNKKQGFTLAELLGVIIIVGIIALLIIPAIDNSVKDSKDNLYRAQIINIEKAAENWAAYNMMELPENEDDYIIVYLWQLKSGGYIDNEVGDPRNGKLFPNDMEIKITRKNNKYVYEVVDGSGTEGNTDIPTIPIITLKGKNPVTIGLNDTYVDAGAIARTYGGIDITGNIVTTNPVDTTTIGTYTVRYNVAYEGRNAKEVTRKVKVVDDRPVITLNGDSVITVRLNDTYTDKGAKAKAYDGTNITNSIITTSNVDITTVGTYTVKYNVTHNGKSATEVTRTVKVVEKNPIITLSQYETTKYEQSVTIDVTVTPYTGNSISSTVYKVNGGSEQTLTNNQIILNTEGEHTIEVIATDNEGNIGNITSRTYKIDTTAPTITFAEGDAGVSLLTIQVPEYDVLTGVTITDNKTNPINNIETDGNLSANVNNYSITYKATDEAGNSTTKTRNFTVTSKTQWTFTSNGTFTVPATGIYMIEMHGGGGGGGGGSFAYSERVDGTGGNGGSSGEIYTTTLVKGQSYNITIGLGGTGGYYNTGQSYAEGTDGTNGGSTSFGSLYVLNGGTGGEGAYVRNFDITGENGTSFGSLASNMNGGSSIGSYGNGGAGGFSANGSNGQPGAIFINWKGFISS